MCVPTSTSFTIGDSKRYSRLGEMTKKIENKPTVKDVTGLKSTLETTLADNFINANEKIGLGATLRALFSEKQGYETTYTSLNENALLTSKTALKTAWTNYSGSFTTLISELYRVIAIQLITPDDKDSVNTKLTDYNSKLSALVIAIENAREAIKTNTIDNIQVGGRNLLSLNANVGYWGIPNGTITFTNDYSAGYKYTKADRIQISTDGLVRYSLINKISEAGRYSLILLQALS